MLILRYQCLDFQMALNEMCCINNHNNLAQKLKYMTDIHQNNIKLKKKQMVQSV